MVGTSFTSMENSKWPTGILSMKADWRGAVAGNAGLADFPTSVLLQRQTCAVPTMNLGVQQ